MSQLDFGGVKHIPSRFQWIVNGYLRISQSLLENNTDSTSIIPTIVFHICLLFYYDFDKWDINTISQDLMFDGNNANIVKYKENEDPGLWSSAYLLRICNSAEGGIHHWRFRIINCDSVWNLIGIWRVTQKSKPPLGYFTTGTNAGYALCLNRGKLVDRSHGGGTLESKYCRECVANDIVEMYLDFKTMELRFTINDQDYGKAFDVDHGKYRAAVCLQRREGAVELLT